MIQAVKLQYASFFAGAAGVSGTTIEPMAIPNKFPSPFIQVHYARGCSLAESFYQSVQSPFQLLILGDPLCQPWAKPPKVTVSGIDPGGRMSGTVAVAATATTVDHKPVREIELLIDGRRVAAAEPAKSLELDTAAIIDGAHELTVVAVDDSPLEIQGRSSVEVVVNNHEHAVLLKLLNDEVKYGQPVQVHVEGTAGTSQVAVFQASRGVARLKGQSGEIKLDSRVLGMGPVRLQAVSLDSSDKPLAISAPAALSIEPDDPLPGQRPPKGKQTFPGLALTLASGRRVEVVDTGPFDWLQRQALGKAKPTS